MILRKLLLVLVVASFAVLPALAGEGSATAPELFTQGKALLAKADFKGAFDAFASAAKADPSNPEYKRQALMIKRVVQLRKMVDEGEVSPKWNKMALSLHVYYLRNKVHSEAISLGELVHSKVKDGESASMLAETYLAVNRNDDCVKLLQGLDPKKKDAVNQIPLAIAFARLGKKDEASKVAAAYPMADDADVAIMMDYARYFALSGRHEACGKTMVKCLEKSPATQQALIRNFVKESSDFKAYDGCPEFAKVMATKSKIAESSCSSGSSCATCPSRSGCGSAEKATDVKKEAPKKDAPKKAPKKDSC